MVNSRVYRKAEPEPVDRKTALVREEGFLERFTGNINNTPAIFNPLDGKFYDASVRNRVMRTLDDRSQDVKVLIRKHAERDLMKTYEEMPKNPGVVFEIWHQQMFANRQLRVVAAAASTSPTEEMIRRGSSANPARPEDLKRVAEELKVQADAVQKEADALKKQADQKQKQADELKKKVDDMKQKAADMKKKADELKKHAADMEKKQ